MQKFKPSGPAILMYSLILLGLILSAVCFTKYYLLKSDNNLVLWIGVVSFMIVYHLWLRIIMGNVTKLFKLDYNSYWYKEKSFEKNIYKFLRVKQWKGKALTYNPELFSIKNYTPHQIALTMTKAETDHWINLVISLVSILFSLVWGEAWIFILTAVLAIAFDSQFILIQRFNRPRVLKLIEKKKSKIKQYTI